MRVTLLFPIATADDFKDVTRPILQMLERKQRFALLVDARSVKMVKAKAIPLLARFIRDNRPAFATYLKGSALIVENAVIRVLLNALFKLQPPVSPNTVTATLPEAETFVNNLT